MKTPLLEVLFQSAGDAFFVADAATGRIVEVNRQAEELTGYERTELLQMHHWQLHPLQLKDRYRLLFEKSARGELPATEVQILRKDGSVLHAEIQGSGFRYEDRDLVFGIFRNVSERVILQKQLEQSERRNRTIAEFAPIGIIVHCRGRIVFVNQRALQEVGLRSATDLLGRHVSEFIHPDDMPQVKERLHRLIHERASVPMAEERLQYQNGEYFHAEVHATAIEWDGQPSVMVAFQNVNDRYLRRKYREGMLNLLQKASHPVDTQAILQELLQVHTERMNAFTSLLSVVEDDTLIVKAHCRAPEDLIRMTEEAGTAGNSLSHFIMQHDTSLFVDNVAKLPIDDSFRKGLAGLSISSCWVYPVRNRYGENMGCLTLYFQESRIPDDEELEALEAASYLVSVFMDRSDLLDENDRLSQVARQTREGVIVTDVNRRVLFVNQAFTNVTGYSLDEVKGKNLRSILHGPATNMATVQFMKQRLQHRLGFDCHILNYRKSGEGFWNDLRIDPLYDRNGTHVGFIGLQSDITEEVEARQRLEQTLAEVDEAARTRAEFLSTISHELRTPLNSITGIVHLLADSNFGEAHPEELEILKGSAERLQVLVNDILDFSQMDAGPPTFQEQPFSLSQLIGKICDSFAPSFQAEFSYTVDPTIPERLLADPARIRQVYDHLLTTLQTAGRGNISLRLKHVKTEDALVTIETDLTVTGSIQEAISRSLDMPNHSTAVMQQILKHYGGEVTVRHTDDSTILQFRMQLQKDYQPESPLTGMTHLMNARVLIVEDYEANILITRKFLELWDVQVDQAYNGEEALHKVRNGNYDLILMDLHMPVMDGYEATRQIRKFNTRIPIVALTASAQGEVQKKIQEAGMNGLIVKPFHPAELNRKISAFLYDRSN